MRRGIIIALVLSIILLATQLYPVLIHTVIAQKHLQQEEVTITVTSWVTEIVTVTNTVTKPYSTITSTITKTHSTTEILHTTLHSTITYYKNVTRYETLTVTQHTTLTKYTTTTLTYTIARQFFIDLLTCPEKIEMGKNFKIVLLIRSPQEVSSKLIVETLIFYPEKEMVTAPVALIGWPLMATPSRDNPYSKTHIIPLRSSGTSVIIDIPEVRWNWIPPSEIIKSSGKKISRIIILIIKENSKLIYKILGSIVLTGMEAYSLYSALKTYFNAKTEADYIVQVNLYDGQNNARLVTQSYKITVYVPEIKQLLLLTWLVQVAITLGLSVVSMILSITATVGKATPLLLVLLPMISGVLYGATISTYIVAYDPDNSYREPVDIYLERTPESLKRFIESLPEGLERNVATALAQFYSFYNASQLSLTKYFGAIEAGEYNYAVLHLENAQKALREVNQKLSEIIYALQDMGVAFQSVPEDIAIEEIVERLGTFELPESLREFFKEIGIVDGEEFYRDSIIGALTETPPQIFTLTLDTYLKAMLQLNEEYLKIIDEELANLKTKVSPAIQTKRQEYTYAPATILEPPSERSNVYLMLLVAITIILIVVLIVLLIVSLRVSRSRKPRIVKIQNESQ